MKYKNTSGKYLMSITCGLCLALAVLASMLVAEVADRAVYNRRSFTAENGKAIYDHEDAAVTEITVSQPVEIAGNDFAKLQEAYKVCKEIVDTEENTSKENTVALSEDTQSTTSATTVVSDENTTTTTTVPSQIVTTTTSASRESNEEESETVSNGKDPFNYNDVSSIASDLNTLGNFVEKLSPDKISWDASDYDKNNCVKITLESEHGCAVLFVKPNGGLPSDETLTGSVKGDAIGSWQWVEDNRNAGCNISSVTWFDSQFGIAPVRDTGIGSTLAQLTDRYLCVNGGATTLYRASDVIGEQNKLNAILEAENLYTFVGGRVYSIGSYLDKYYNGRENAFRFEDCDYVVQYGCNSIMEHNYTTGSWIIEYAVKEDSVVGIDFMNKSYYQTEKKPAASTNISSSGSEADTTSTTRAVASEDNSENDSSDVVSEVISEGISEDQTDAVSDTVSEVQSDNETEKSLDSSEEETQVEDDTSSVESESSDIF